MSKKLTKRDHFNALLTLSQVQENPVLVDFINKELELLAKKNSAEKKPTATQLENNKLKEVILKSLTSEPITITDLIKSVPELNNLTNQRVSALIRQLVLDGQVIRITDKRKALFALAD